MSCCEHVGVRGYYIWEGGGRVRNIKVLLMCDKMKCLGGAKEYLEHAGIGYNYTTTSKLRMTMAITTSTGW